MSSALRMIQRLCDARLVSRRADPTDGRRFFVELAPDVRQRMEAYFAAREEPEFKARPRPSHIGGLMR